MLAKALDRDEVRVCQHLHKFESVTIRAGYHSVIFLYQYLNDTWLLIPVPEQYFFFNTYAILTKISLS